MISLRCKERKERSGALAHYFRGRGPRKEKRKKMNKTVQDMKMQIEATWKAQMEGILDTKKLGKRTETTDSSNRIQEVEESISGIEDTIEKKSTHQLKKMLNIK